MYYHSEKPKVVGEFDADGFNQQAMTFEESYDSFELSYPSPASELIRHFEQALGKPYTSFEDIIDVQYSSLFRQNAFGSMNTDGDVWEISYIRPDRDTTPRQIDEWHPDIFTGKLALPEILTGASRWPTQWLIGRIAVSWQQYRQEKWFEYKFWESDDGKDAIQSAIEKGNAHVHTFEPGDILKAPSGAIHRRKIPPEESGFRFFGRLFPRFISFHSGTNIGRMRPW